MLTSEANVRVVSNRGSRFALHIGSAGPKANVSKVFVTNLRSVYLPLKNGVLEKLVNIWCSAYIMLQLGAPVVMGEGVVAVGAVS